MDFLQYEGEQRLVWYTNNAGILIPAPDFPGASKSKMVYFIRKRPPVELTIENIRDVSINTIDGIYFCTILRRFRTHLHGRAIAFCENLKSQRLL